MSLPSHVAPRLAWALLPLRLIVGYGFVVHGWAKLSRGPANFGKLLDLIGVPLPTETAWMVTLVEITCGIAIMVGAFVLIAGIPLIATMLVAMFTIQLPYGFSSVQTIGLTASGPRFGPPGYEINLLYIAALIALMLAGPGSLAVDGWLARRRGRADPPNSRAASAA